MELLHAAVALLASMVFVLAGMVGWLYWQQTRLFQNMNSVLMAIGDITHAMDNSAPAEPEPEPQPKPVPVAVEEDDEDDRASVEESAAEVVDGPPAPIDVDALQTKTKKELQDMLSKRGLPFSKTDAKPTLISLLKATA
jgi:hypothetical protein